MNIGNQGVTRRVTIHCSSIFADLSNNWMSLESPRMVVLKSENPVSHALENRFFEKIWGPKGGGVFSKTLAFRRGVQKRLAFEKWPGSLLVYGR